MNFYIKASWSGRLQIQPRSMLEFLRHQQTLSVYPMAGLQCQISKKLAYGFDREPREVDVAYYTQVPGWIYQR